MKKVMLFIGAAALAVTFTACSNDQVVESTGQLSLTKGSGINFSPLVNKSTRSTVVNTAPELGSFAVSAYWGEAITAGKDADSHKIFMKALDLSSTEGGATALTVQSGDAFADLQNVKIIYKDGGWDYENAEKMAYWPFRETEAGKEYVGDVPLNFVAVSPASAVSAPVTIGGTIAEYEIPAIADQVDLCYAVNLNKAQKDGVVDMYFKHALSQMIFKAKMASGLKVYIKDINIKNLKNKATYTLPSATTEAGVATEGAWNTFSGSATYSGMTAPAAGYIAVPDSSAGNEAYATQLTSAKQEILFMPQSALAEDGSSWSKADLELTTPVTPAATTKIILAITCKVVRGTDWLIGAASGDDEWETRYFPINTEWLQGKKYIYTLLFGGVSDPENPNPSGDNPGDDNPGGYNEDGTVNPPTVPITFSASVEEWTPVRSNVSF